MTPLPSNPDSPGPAAPAPSAPGPGPGSRLERGALPAYVLGAALLGSGGGGDAAVYLPRLLASVPVDGIELVPVAEAGRRGLRTVVAVGMIGAASVLTEKLPHGGEIGEAVAAACRWSGREVDAVVPVEAAGVNAALGVAAAAELGLPLLDADLMGRALPRYDQVTLVVADPGAMGATAVAEPGGQVLVVDRCSPRALERTVRTYVSQAGGWAGAAFGPFGVDVLTGQCCLGTPSRALDLGTRLLGHGGRLDPPDLAAALGGRLLAAGRVLEIERGAGASYTRASVAVLDRSGSVLRLEAESEYLAALRDGEPVVTCPELLCVLERRTGTPVPADRLRPGDDVQVLALPGPAWWTRSAERLAVVSPRAFGLDLDPVLLDGPAAPDAAGRS